MVLIVVAVRVQQAEVAILDFKGFLKENNCFLCGFNMGAGCIWKVDILLYYYFVICVSHFSLL